MLKVTRKKRQRGSLYQRAGSPNYYGKYRDPETSKVRRVSLKTTDKAEARAKLDAIVSPPKAEAPKPKAPMLKVGAFQSTAERWLAEYLSRPISDKRKERAVLLVGGRFAKAFGHRAVGAIGLTEINRYMARRFEEGAAKATVKIEKQHLSGIFRLAVREGTVRFDPTEDYRFPKNLPQRPERVALTQAEFQSILAHVPSEIDRAALTLYFETGCRKAELEGATQESVFVNGGGLLKLHVHSTKVGKGRDIPLSKAAQDALEVLRAHGEGEAILPTWGINHLYNAIRKAAVRAGYDLAAKPINLHSLRHSFASRWANTPGVPLVVVRDWCGHSNISVTSLYVHVDTAKADRLMAELGS